MQIYSVAILFIHQLTCFREYLKREDQYLAYRTLQEQNHSRLVRDALNNQRSLAQGNNGAPTADAGMDDDMIEDDADTQEPHGSKIIVIHPGSQYLRIGLANDALPKTVPMVIARRSDKNESEGKEPMPKRVKINNEVPAEPEKWWGEEVRMNHSHMIALLTESSGDHCTLPCVRI
jgi:actin-related protein 8